VESLHCRLPEHAGARGRERQPVALPGLRVQVDLVLLRRLDVAHRQRARPAALRPAEHLLRQAVGLPARDPVQRLHYPVSCYMFN